MSTGRTTLKTRAGQPAFYGSFIHWRLSMIDPLCGTAIIITRGLRASREFRLQVHQVERHQAEPRARLPGCPSHRLRQNAMRQKKAEHRHARRHRKAPTASTAWSSATSLPGRKHGASPAGDHVIVSRQPSVQASRAIHAQCYELSWPDAAVPIASATCYAAPASGLA